MSDVWYCINESDTGDWPTSIWDGLGIPASQIPSTGTSGAAYLYNDIAAQGASATDEFYSNILTTPASGTFTHTEYSAFSLVGAADGTHLATYEGYLNGIKYGDYTITMEIGTTSSSFSGTIGKASISGSNKQLGISAGYSGGITEQTLAIISKQLDVQAGTSVSFSGTVNKINLPLETKPLSVEAGWQGVSGKTSININSTPMAIVVGNILTIVKRDLVLNSKTLSMGITTYPVIPVERVFGLKQKTNVFILKGK